MSVVAPENKVSALHENEKKHESEGRLTEPVRISKCVEKGQSNNGSGACNASNAKNTRHQNLRPCLHLQIPDQKDGKQANRKIARASADTIKPAHGDDYLPIDTCPM
jgi:hypothetical protein